MIGTTNHSYMLNTRVVYTVVSNGILSTDKEVDAAMSVDKLEEHIDALAGLPDLVSYEGSVLEGGIEGDRGFFTVRANACVMHAYFIPDNQFVENSTVRIELMPMETGTGSSDSSQHVTGLVSIVCLKELIRRMDQGEFPTEFAVENVQ